MIGNRTRAVAAVREVAAKRVAVAVRLESVLREKGVPEHMVRRLAETAIDQGVAIVDDASVEDFAKAFLTKVIENKAKPTHVRIALRTAPAFDASGLAGAAKNGDGGKLAEQFHKFVTSMNAQITDKEEVDEQVARNPEPKARKQRLVAGSGSGPGCEILGVGHRLRPAAAAGGRLERSTSSSPPPSGPRRTRSPRSGTIDFRGGFWHHAY